MIRLTNKQARQLTRLLERALADDDVTLHSYDRNDLQAAIDARDYWALRWWYEREQRSVSEYCGASFLYLRRMEKILGLRSVTCPEFVYRCMVKSMRG